MIYQVIERISGVTLSKRVALGSPIFPPKIESFCYLQFHKLHQIQVVNIAFVCHFQMHSVVCKKKPLLEHFSRQENHIKQIRTSITQPMPNYVHMLIGATHITDLVIFYDWLNCKNIIQPNCKNKALKLIVPKITNGFILAKQVQSYWRNHKIRVEMAKLWANWATNSTKSRKGIGFTCNIPRRLGNGSYMQLWNINDSPINTSC